MRETPRSRLVGYGVAVLGIAVTLLLRWLLLPVMGYHTFIFISFFPAVLLAAYFGGFWPGLLATVLSVLAAKYFLAEPLFSLEITSAREAIAVTIYVLTGLITSALSESRLRSRRRMAASERRYAVTLASIGDAVIATDTQAQVTFLNPAAEALTGWPLADAAGRPLAEVFRIINEQTRQPAENPAAKVLRLGTVVGLANHSALLARDGRETPIDDWGAPIIDDHGAIVGVVLVFRDVTQRRQADDAEAFRRANERLQLAVRGSNVGVWELDMPHGEYRRARRRYVNVWEQLGYDGAPAGRGSLLDEVHPDDRAHLEEAMRRYLAGETTVYETEIRFRHKDGSYRMMLGRGAAVRDAVGKPIRFVGISVDITGLKRAEEALRESEERFRGTFENAAVGIAHCDAQGRFLRVNEKYCEIVGYSREELLNRAIKDQSHPDDLATTLEKYNPLIRGELPSYMEEKRDIRKDGSVFWIDISVSVQRDAQGSPLHAIFFVQDISERKRLEGELRQAKEAAEAANRAKDEFLANVSHEIRTPMNAILGMTELVLDTPLADDQRQCLQTVKSAADNLLGIINDLLDFAKIEAGRLDLDLGDFSLRSAVGSSLRALAPRAHRKGLEVVCNVQPDVSDALIGDAGRLRQVLLNLVGNAIKFTEKGEVVVQVEAEPVAEPAGRQDVVLRFSVRDTGIGIPPDKQERIFRAFEQEDTSTTRKYGGTGLGLTIAARLVALMGGQISVDSTPGQGSTFAFTARFGLQPHPTEPTAAQPPVLLQNLPVLIIDDNATNRQILLEWLRGRQMDPVAAGDGVAAMGALWEAATQGRRYALVLLDARMPDTDGLALAAEIRKRAELSATRIILLSSGDRPGDWDRIRELRIDAHLLKPIQQDELLDTIYQVMSRADYDEAREARPAAGRELAPAPAPAATPLHILLAEDDEFSAHYMEQLLARGGHRVRLTTNGREALSLLGIRDQGSEVRGQKSEASEGPALSPLTSDVRPLTSDFDLLLLDIHMPELDGFAVVGAIRERERAAGGHLPVIALTARSRKEDREQCLAAGMDGFLSKPVVAAALFAALHRLVPAPRVSRLYQADPGERGSLLDPVAVLTACGDDVEGLRRICQDFQVYAPARLAEMDEALRDRDAPRLRQAAHKFCPLLLAFSTVAGNVASDLEDHAAQGQLEEAQPLVERLETMTQELMRLLGGLSLESLRRQAKAADDHEPAVQPPGQPTGNS